MKNDMLRKRTIAQNMLQKVAMYYPTEKINMGVSTMTTGVNHIDGFAFAMVTEEKEQK